MNAAALRAVREGAGLFRPADRGLVEVTGSERVRWLDGMISADVTRLAAGRGAYALALTHQGRIVADLHVMADAEAFALELARAQVTALLEHLERRIIADDVALRDASDEVERLALEGPQARAVLARAGAELPELAPEAWARVELAGHELRVAAWSFTGSEALQLFAPAGGGDAVAEALVRAGAVPASDEVLECLRIEAGVPRSGRELDESVLPAEARLDERAVSTTKGCYTGQEVVARMRSRGRVGHLLVGLRFAEAAPAPGTRLAREGREVGQVTSAVVSPGLGPIGLGYVRSDCAEPDTELESGAGAARVAALPFEGAA